NVPSLSGERLRKRHQFSPQHRLAASDHDVPRIVFPDALEDFFDRQIDPFRRPRGIRRVAEPAAQVAAAGAHEDALGAGQKTFTLPGTKYLGDSQVAYSSGSTRPASAKPASRSRQASH